MACKRVISLVARNVKELYQWGTTPTPEAVPVPEKSSGGGDGATLGRQAFPRFIDATGQSSATPTSSGPSTRPTPRPASSFEPHELELD